MMYKSKVLYVIFYVFCIFLSNSSAQEPSDQDRSSLSITISPEGRQANAEPSIHCAEYIKLQLLNKLIAGGYTTILERDQSHRIVANRTTITGGITRSSIEKTALEHKPFDIDLRIQHQFSEDNNGLSWIRINVEVIDQFNGTYLCPTVQINSKKRKFKACEQAISSALDHDDAQKASHIISALDGMLMRYKTYGKPSKIKFEIDLASNRTFDDQIDGQSLSSILEKLIYALSVNGNYALKGNSAIYLDFDTNLPFGSQANGLLSELRVKELITKKIMELGIEISHFSVIGPWYNIVIK
jgi:Family of unknown function (DUF6175)